MKRLHFILFVVAALLMCGCDPMVDVPAPKPEVPETPQEPEVPEEPEVPAVPVKLSGSVIGTTYSVDYNSGMQSMTVNTKENAFDGNYNTFFASYDRSQTWVGLDLGQKHVITQVGWSPRIDHVDRVELALFEGANKADFSDAIPIHIVKERGVNRTMHYADVECTRGFRYVRYVSPNDVRCNVAEIEFHGYPSEGDDSKLYQLTNLPTVVINTFSAKEITSKEVEIGCNVYIISETAQTF